MVKGELVFFSVMAETSTSIDAMSLSGNMYMKFIKQVEFKIMRDLANSFI